MLCVAMSLPLPARSRVAPGASVTAMVAGAFVLAGVTIAVYALSLPGYAILAGGFGIVG